MGRGIYDRRLRQAPPGFDEDAKKMGRDALMKKYHAGALCVWRWCDDLGIESRPVGRPKKPVAQIDTLTGKEIAVYPCGADAAAVVHGAKENICAAAKKGGNAYGWRWRYVEEDFGIPGVD